MKTLILVLGGIITMIGLVGFLSPSTLMRMVSGMRKGPMFAVAIGLRLVLGVIFVLGADLTRFPVVIQTLGVLMIVAAIGLLLVGRERFWKLIDWWAAKPTPFVRGWLLLAVAFGAFVIYAAL